MAKSKAVFTSRYSHICTLTFPNEILYDDFYVDVIYDLKNKEYEAWIYRKDYSVKQYAFSAYTTTIDEFIKYVEIRFTQEAELYNSLTH